jgi:hypothetical protein
VGHHYPGKTNISSQKGEAYQVMLDYLEGGNMGGVYGEALQNVTAKVSEGWEKLWKKGQWNSIRARIEGAVPRIQVWMNGTQVTDFTDTANHLPGGAVEGMIALQVHGGNRCKPEQGFEGRAAVENLVFGLGDFLVQQKSSWFGGIGTPLGHEPALPVKFALERCGIQWEKSNVPNVL